MKFFLKKLFPVAIFALCFFCVKPAYAEMRVGGYIRNTFPVSLFSQYNVSSLGAGAVFEYELPIVRGLGFSAHAEGAYGFSGTEKVKGSWDVKIYAGIFYNIPIKSSGFFIQPEFNYGISIQGFTTGNNKWLWPDGSTGTKYFIDNLIQIAVTARYKIKVLPMSVEAGLTYTLLPDPNGLANVLGYRLGALYHF